MSKIAYISTKVPRVCAQCGSAFTSYPSQPRKFCSKPCSGRYAAEHGMPRKPRTGSNVPCENCGTEFWVIRSDLGRRRFCSKACHDIAQTKPPVIKLCAVCGKELSLKPSQAIYRGGERVYCSRSCMGIGKTKRPLDRIHNGKPARLDEYGYVWVWEPENPASKSYKGWIAEHRLIAEQHLGRPLDSSDEVHHVNRVKDDNRPENLQVLDGKTHAIITAQQRMTDRELIAEYRRRFGVI